MTAGWVLPDQNGWIRWKIGHDSRASLDQNGWRTWTENQTTNCKRLIWPRSYPNPVVSVISHASALCWWVRVLHWWGPLLSNSLGSWNWCWFQWRPGYTSRINPYVHVVGGHSRSGFAQVVHGIDHTANPVHWMLMILFSNDETNKRILPLISVFFFYSAPALDR